IGRVDGEFIINPTIEEEAISDLNLIVAGTKDAVNMVEAEAEEIAEDIILDAIMFGHQEIKRLVEFQEEIIAAVGMEKAEVNVAETNETLYQQIEENIKSKLKDAITVTEKKAREDAIEKVKEEVLAPYDEVEDEELITEAKAILDQMVKNEVRR